MTGHPIRTAKVHVFQRVDSDGKGYAFIAKFYPYKTYPVIFNGATHDEVVAKAEAMRTEAIEKHEASVIARQEAKAKADAARAAKKKEKA